MAMSQYGAHRDIPNTYADVPPPLNGSPPRGLSHSSATLAELQAAGFHGGPDRPHGADRPGQQPLEEFLVDGTHEFTPEVTAQLMRHAKFAVLRDPSSQIVATWDEGRWWTPSESDEFTRQVSAEMTGADPPMNREQRRRAKRERRRGGDA